MSALKHVFRTAMDVALSVPLLLAAPLMKFIRAYGVHRLPVCKSLLLRVGVFPIRDHYYEPRFTPSQEDDSSQQERDLPGIHLNEEGQLELLSHFSYAQELSDVPNEKKDNNTFHFNNGMFEAGDAEIWYQMIRHHKPARIVEIGSGNSTLLAQKAIKKNEEDDESYVCHHTCIEPYENPWLEQLEVSVLRQTVESIDPNYFITLEENDILFIDSSHVIRPGGDVLCEYLDIIPRLQGGVVIHIHDIFTPRDYPGRWRDEEVKLWNEQYLLEALITGNSGLSVVLANNFLKHHNFQKLKSAAPKLNESKEPGSFYIKRVSV